MVVAYLYTENDFPSLGICYAQATKHVNGEIHPVFETQGRSHQKSKTGVSLAPQKVLMFSKNSNIKDWKNPHAGSYWCYCKIMVFSLFKLETTYYYSSKGNK